MRSSYDPALDGKRFLDGRVMLHCGDCIDVLAGMPENSVDCVVCDPPYHLTSIVKRFGTISEKDVEVARANPHRRTSGGFMGKQWDGGDIAFRVETWAAVLRVLKPGGYLLAFASTRGFGRMSVAIEDAGFITHPLIAHLFDATPEVVAFVESLTQEQLEALIRVIDLHDGGLLAWIFGSGFPKATRIKAEGYDGFRYGGQALKPAIEPIYMGQKPFAKGMSGTENILAYGTGAVNIGACRIGETVETWPKSRSYAPGQIQPGGIGETQATGAVPAGRWPANLIHDGSEEVLAGFPDRDGAVSNGRSGEKGVGNWGMAAVEQRPGFGDSGSAARFFYTAKADAEDRIGSKHPTVKPLDLIQYLCRLVTPPGGTVLDCFAGTGTTGEAAWREGFNAILIEREPEYQADIARRMDLAVKPTKRAAVAKSKNNLQGAEGTPLFGGQAA